MKNKIGEVLELFSPAFNQEKTILFNDLVNRIGQAYPHYRAQVIQNELNGIIVDDNNIEDQKYKSALNILIDLVQQGWQLEVHNGQLFLKMSAQDSVDKGYIRFRLSSERKAQFQDESVMRFVEKMETTKQYNNQQISIRNLIGSSEALIEKIQNEDEPIVRPYIQLISHQKDVYTGYWLSDIWRYFRYTWAIPYKTMPGRNLFYLVRDAAQPFHPIIGIFALGNSVLNLTVRDDEIGWTVEAISKQLLRKKDVSHSAQIVSGTNGKTVGAKVERFLETDDEYEKRIREYSSKTISILMGNIESAIKDLYVRDLDYHRGTKYPKPEKVEELIALSNQLRDLAIDNKKTTGRVNFEQEAQEILFKKKRAAELARLLEAKIIFNKYRANDTSEWLKKLMASEEGRKAVNVALVANRKTKIGSNMMEIIVCGSIPPYNQLLGGKLVSILACSPQVVRDYTDKYADQVSEIASRMKGEKVVRDSRLAFLGTTSLYSVGSSQYNRIKVPMGNDFVLTYKEMGITEGYGTVYFSKTTTSSLMRVLELQDGGRRINNIFGEGTSPRFRLISRGLSTLGIKSNAFLQHYTPRIVYSMELAKNTNDFLCGGADKLEYPYDITNSKEVEMATQAMADFWYERWLKSRLKSVDIVERLANFDVNSVLVSMTR
ncbi:MAG: DUF4338 domain-containing protein [Clostridia bacterium]|nr:DUF4338 domain-containing protein [Clostridia bacterium]